MWRQGDLFLATISRFPRDAARLGHGVLLEGEATGHSHRVEDLDAAVVWRSRGNLYVQVVADAARVVHPEHGPITLRRGLYRVWRQREYAPHALTWIED